MTPLNIIDELGLLKTQLADLHKQEADLSERVRLQLLHDGTPIADGNLYRARINVYERTSLNLKAVKVILPQSQYPQLYRSTAVEELSISNKV